MGALTLPASGSVYVDANAVIYAVEKIEPYASLLEPLWQAAKAECLQLEVVIRPNENHSRLDWPVSKPVRNAGCHMRDRVVGPW